MMSKLKEHAWFCEHLNSIYKKKSADYGDSFDKGLDKYGTLSALIRMEDKMNRFEQLIRKDGNDSEEVMVIDETIRDTLLDLANYALMTVMWLENPAEVQVEEAIARKNGYNSVEKD